MSSPNPTCYWSKVFLKISFGRKNDATTFRSQVNIPLLFDGWFLHWFPLCANELLLLCKKPPIFSSSVKPSINAWYPCDLKVYPYQNTCVLHLKIVVVYSIGCTHKILILNICRKFSCTFQICDMNKSGNHLSP